MGMRNATIIASIMGLSLITLAGCEQNSTEPLLVATEDPYQGVLAAEHLAEMSFDQGDIKTHMGLWAKDPIEFTSPFGNFKTAAEYEGFIQGFYDYTQQSGGTRHHVLNPIVVVNGDEAEVTAYLHVVNKKDGSFLGSSVIRDRLVKMPEGWRFTARSVESDQPPMP